MGQHLQIGRDCPSGVQVLLQLIPARFLVEPQFNSSRAPDPRYLLVARYEQLLQYDQVLCRCHLSKRQIDQQMAGRVRHPRGAAFQHTHALNGTRLPLRGCLCEYHDFRADFRIRVQDCKSGEWWRVPLG